MAETIRDILNESAHCLSDARIPDCRLEASLIAGDILNLTQAALHARTGQMIEPAQADEIRRLTRMRIQHIPLAYLTGKVNFSGLSFIVGPGVLIPRPDSECLVEAGIAAIGSLVKQASGEFASGDPVKIIDLCTGTGCIGISLADWMRKQDIPCELWLTEIDPVAANYARNNLAHHDLAKITRLVEADLFPADTVMRWHLIVANPPYIPSSQIENLMPEVRLYEPRQALDGGPGGLAFLRRIIGEAPERLLPGGWLLLEHGYDQSAAVGQMLAEAAVFDLIPPLRDPGGHLRVSGGHLRVNSGNPRIDSGNPRIDSGNPRIDSGNPRIDSTH